MSGVGFNFLAGRFSGAGGGSFLPLPVATLRDGLAKGFRSPAERTPRDARGFRSSAAPDPRFLCLCKERADRMRHIPEAVTATTAATVGDDGVAQLPPSPRRKALSPKLAWGRGLGEGAAPQFAPKPGFRRRFVLRNTAKTRLGRISPRFPFTPTARIPVFGLDRTKGSAKQDRAANVSPALSHGLSCVVAERSSHCRPGGSPSMHTPIQSHPSALCLHFTGSLQPPGRIHP